MCGCVFPCYYFMHTWQGKIKTFRVLAERRKVQKGGAREGSHFLKWLCGCVLHKRTVIGCPWLFTLKERSWFFLSDQLLKQTWDCCEFKRQIRYPVQSPVQRRIGCTFRNHIGTKLHYGADMAQYWLSIWDEYSKRSAAICTFDAILVGTESKKTQSI